MVQVLTDFPPHVAAYKATGSVSKKEYEQVVMNLVNDVAEKSGKLNFLVKLETDFENYSIGAFIDYVKISFEHFFKWERMAIVTDETWVRKAYDLLSSLVHGEVRGYTLSEYEQAKEWVSGPLSS